MKDDAHRVTTSKKDVVNKNIEHKYLVCDDRDKLNVLLQFLQSEGDERGVVFCRTKLATKTLARSLAEKNVPADGIHGDLKQMERDKVMRAFQNESLRILVATDLAARGLDIESLAFVVHYELPDKDEYYTHRSGRTARAGKRGTSLCLVNTKELKSIKYLEKNLGIGFKQVRQVK
jgi:ATP-dependent RNA helicase DeaD